MYAEMKINRRFEIGKANSRGWGRIFPQLLKTSLVALVVASSIGLTPASAAQPGNDYEKLETKFFSRTYPKDTSDARLDRLEKLVFGEAKDGNDRERLDALLKSIPADEVADGGADSGTSTAPKKSAPASQPAKAQAPAARQPDADDGGVGQYPAVTAIEKKLFGKDFENENVEDRLTRLEKKAFGKQSSSNDLSERTDALKAKTGIDVAHQGGGAGWDDEDEGDTDYPEPSSPVSRRYPGVSPSDAGRSFSGRDIGADLNRAFNRQSGSGGSGSYGMGGGNSYSSSGSGAYGFGGGSQSGYRSAPPSFNSRSGKAAYGSSTSPFSGSSTATRRPPSVPDADDDNDTNLAYAPPTAPRRGAMPPVAPPVVRGGGAASAGAAAGGLSFQLEALETQVFGKTYKDPLIQRLERLETTVFPGDKNAKSRTPVERVNRLTQVIPIAGGQPVAQNPNQDLDGNGQVDMSQIPADQSSIAQQPLPKSRGGLGKIMNSLGNFLGGGMSVGSYPMNGGTSNLVTDPQTGMLLDQFSGNLINPTTGAVVGRKAGFGYPTTMPSYGVNSFNNGFSSPYYGNSMYSNPAFGVGGSGIRFGTGGVRFGGGMWP